MTRRFFTGLAMAGLLRAQEREQRGLPGLPHFAPKAKRVIYLFQSGGPSQIELFDYKPRAGRLSRERSFPTPSGTASA